MNATQEVREQYKQAVKQTIRYPRVAYHKGRVSGLRTALFYLGLNDDEIYREMYQTCEEEVKDERAQEDVGPGDVSYDEEGFVIEEELDAIERPASQAQVEADESGEDIYECEHCNAEFRESEILYRQYGGEVGNIAFCPRCKEATKLICVTGGEQIRCN